MKGEFLLNATQFANLFFQVSIGILVVDDRQQTAVLQNTFVSAQNHLGGFPAGDLIAYIRFPAFAHYPQIAVKRSTDLFFRQVFYVDVRQAGKTTEEMKFIY
jgi:hypothetical protein